MMKILIHFTSSMITNNDTFNENDDEKCLADTFKNASDAQQQ